MKKYTRDLTLQTEFHRDNIIIYLDQISGKDKMSNITVYEKNLEDNLVIKTYTLDASNFQTEFQTFMDAISNKVESLLFTGSGQLAGKIKEKKK